MNEYASGGYVSDKMKDLESQIEKLKKGITNANIPDSIKSHMRSQVKELQNRYDIEDAKARKDAKMRSKSATKKIIESEKRAKEKQAKFESEKRAKEKQAKFEKKKAKIKKKKLSEAKPKVKKNPANKKSKKRLKKKAIKKVKLKEKKKRVVKKATKKKLKKVHLGKRVRKFNKGRSRENLRRDEVRLAKPIGKRKSADGKTYYEYRANRSDIRRKRFPYLEDGGKLDMEKEIKINQTVDSIMNTIQQYITEGRRYATFRWLKEHHLLGYVQKESRHEIANIKRKYIEMNVRHLIDYEIV